MENHATICSINGPVVKVKGSRTLKMQEMTQVGKQKLVGEVIAIENDETIVQVYESTSGLKIGEPVLSTGMPMSVTLGPGIIGGIFDGIQRPLTTIQSMSGSFIDNGMSVSSIDEQKKWEVEMIAKQGDAVVGGNVLAQIKETKQVTCKIMIPPGIEGTIEDIMPSGDYTVIDVIAHVRSSNGELKEIKLAHKWGIRTPRPYRSRERISKPLLTGQRVIDTMFPIAKGGTAAIPGGFGTGKTMTQHQFAKWSDADIIVYIGCGERGNEMTQVLEEFSHLIDPRTNQTMMERTILIANTSNMPVAAREASIYTGITIAEFYRDMGYHVALMADSTSRWAEALREISGRLEELPAEEGFPAYLPSRLSEFYERAGYFKNYNDTEGSITIIGAVSPQGGDFSEPVTQNTKRFVRAFLALDKNLAYARHFPAINWLNSYSEYLDNLSDWYAQYVNENFMNNRSQTLALLAEESNLLEIVKLIGSDVLPDDQKLILEISKTIRLGFLQQNAYHENDAHVPMQKQYLMLDVILYLNKRAKEVIATGVPISQLVAKGVFNQLITMKYDIPNDKNDMFTQYRERINQACDELLERAEPL